MSHRYALAVAWSDADQAAEAPELPGCAADGRTYHEAIGERRGGDRRVETAREMGRAIPEPKGRPRLA